MFRFKKFAVEQDRCAMKVGTDGVLLGAWASVEPADRRILDIGTGTGVIALMLAQRSRAHVTALDIDADSAFQARANADASPWSDRIGVVCSRVQEFAPCAKFDLVVSNPPFYDASLLPSDAARAVARHTAALPFTDLIEAAVRLTASEGRFAVILPFAEAAHFLAAASSRLWLVRRTDVRTTPRRGVRRSLMEFSFRPPAGGALYRELVIQDAERAFTPDYRALTRDFYLKF